MQKSLSTCAGRAARRTRTRRGARRRLVSAVVRGLAVWMAGLAWTVPVRGAESGSPPVIGRPAYLGSSWTTAEGLPSNTIRTLAQTPDGYVWVGTDAGLVRFDGVHFTVFGLQDGLQSTKVSSLLVDRAGTLWLGTFGGGISRREGSRFRTWTRRDGLGNDEVLALIERGDGTIWIQTRKGVSQWRDGLVTTLADDDPENRPALPEIDPLGVVLNAPPPADLFRIQDGAIRLARVPPGWFAPRVNCVLVDRAGRVWVGAGPELFCCRDGRWTRYGTGQGLTIEQVLRLAEGSDGGLFVLQGAGNLMSFHEGRIERVKCRPILGDDLNIAMISDRQGCIWLGTYRDGLTRLRREKVTTWQADEPIQVLSVAESSDGTLWTGTVGNGLLRATGGRLVRCDLGTAAWNTETLYSVVAGRDGGLWLAASSALLHWTPGRAAVPVPLDLLQPREAVWVMAADGEDGVWLGTNLGRVLRLLRGKVSLVTDGLSGSRVTALLGEPDGTLSIGTSTGLYRLKDKALSVFTTADGLASNSINTLHRRADGALWIGTAGGGLSCLRGGRVQSFDASHGIPNEFIGQIVEDSAGDLWFGSRRGVFCVRRAEMDRLAAGVTGFVHAALLGRPEGLVAEECSGGYGTACRKTMSGLLCFATLKGLAVVDPGDFKDKESGLHVAVEDAAIDDAARPVGADALVIPAGTHRVEVRYVALGSSTPERIGFRYRMEGLEDWVEAGTARSAVYHRLPPGRYRFRVQASSENGSWGTAEGSLAVIAQPGLAQTWWARSIIAALVLAVAYSWHRSRLRAQSRAHRMQQEFSQRLIESQEQERKRVASELHDGLGQDLLLIKSRLHAISSQFVHTPDLGDRVLETSEVTSRAIAEVRAITAALRPAALGQIGLTRALEWIVKQVSSASPTKFSTEIEDIDGLLAADQEIHLYRIIQEGLNNVIKHSGAEQAIMEVRREPSDIHVSLYDNGRGFVPPSESGAGGPGPGLGLIGMAERSRVLRGELQLQSAPGRGTRLTVRIPIRGDRN